MRRLTVVYLNRLFARHGLRAKLEKNGRDYYVLNVAGVEGGEWFRYTSTRRVSRYDAQGWLNQAEAGIEWARKRVEAWNEAKPKFMKLEVVNVHDLRREWITIENGPDLRERFDRKRDELYGVNWRLSKAQPRRAEGEIAPAIIVGEAKPFRLPAEPLPQEPNLTLEDAIALAHLVAEDLSEGFLTGDKIKTVQELVGGPVKQTNGSYKYVLLVGRWAIKVDKKRKPGDHYYVGAAGEALLIEQIKKNHADIAKHFPVTAVVNYYTAVQERADIDGPTYSRQSKLIVQVAKQANIGDYHQGNVGFRPGDDTPIFIDVAGSNNIHAADHHYLNNRFLTEYQIDENNRRAKELERILDALRESNVELTAKLSNLNAGA